MKFTQKPTSLLITCLFVLITSTIIVLIIVLNNYNFRHNALQVNKPLQDSFFFKSAPISGSVKLWLGDTIIYPANLDIGQYITRGPMTLIKPSERQLKLLPSALGKPDSSYYTLTVPFFGSKYRLHFPEGTEVIMQVGSSLRFPRTFSNQERMVELNGCAYFSVSQEDSRPFIIKTRRLTTKGMKLTAVVQDYVNDSSAKVTVEYGTVEATSRNSTVQILAGHSAELDSSSNFALHDAFIKNELYWTKEYFEFDGLNMKQGCKKIADAYRMHIIFQGKIRDGAFGSGLIQTDLPLKTLLKDLELPDLHFHIRMQDSTIVVIGN